MAKRHRAVAGPAPSSKKKKRAPARASSKRSRSAVGRSGSKVPRASAPPVRTTYVQAVALYERGVRALQRRNYPRAAEILGSVLERFPEERELNDRVRLYLRVCERQSETEPSPPKTPEQLVSAATFALNAGDFDGAIAYLASANRQEPDNDHVHYMLASAYALRGEARPALTHLQRAIELNPNNRALARHDTDLDLLRGNDGFRGAMEAAEPVRRRVRGRRSRA